MGAELSHVVGQTNGQEETNFRYFAKAPTNRRLKRRPRDALALLLPAKPTYRSKCVKGGRGCATAEYNIHSCACMAFHSHSTVPHSC